jgi:hypothetical protein
MAWQPISPEVNVRGPMQWMGQTMLSNDIEEYGNISSVRKMKALTVKMETVTLIDRG